MGTRHLTAVVLDGQYKIAQYGQWDGYPSGSGRDALAFLRSIDRKTFENKVRTLRFATEDELKAQWTECGADPDSEWVDMDVSNIHAERYPQNSRDTGAGILALVYGSDPMAVNDSLDFAADGLYCEWVYVIDLDRSTFEVFKGFNQTKLGNGERFYFLQDEEAMAQKGEYSKDYYPAKLIAVFSLDNLPTEEEFLRKCEPDEDEEEDDLPEGITGQEPGLSKTAPTYQYVDDQEREVFEYLDGLRESGITNMFGAAPYVKGNFNSISSKKCSEYVVKWMETFSDRHPKEQ